jgi:ADP-ribose pyrophosphatase YjhB (NUDIX family)
MKFCSACGAPITMLTPVGDHLPRAVCTVCQEIHYVNPKVVVGCVPQFEGRVLLCRRAIEPRKGFWTMPAGFMENGETAREGARRETLEETQAVATIGELITMMSIPMMSQVHMMFRAQLQSDHHGATTESSEVRFFSEAEIPWGELAFPTVQHTLKHFFEDRARGVHALHIIDLGPIKI